MRQRGRLDGDRRGHRFDIVDRRGVDDRRADDSGPDDRVADDGRGRLIGDRGRELVDDRGYNGVELGRCVDGIELGRRVDGVDGVDGVDERRRVVIRRVVELDR